MTLEIVGPDETEEGLASEEFEAKLTPSTATATAWQWSFKPIPNAGWNPNVPYANPDQQKTTVTKAKWFALPNQLVAPVSCTYTLVCKATVDGNLIEGTKSWTVKVNLEGVYTEHPVLDGEVDIDSKIQPKFGKPDEMETVWFVDQTTHRLIRIPAYINNLPPASSEFHDKVHAHEEEHVNQWETGNWSGYYSPAEAHAKTFNVTSKISEASCLREAMRLVKGYIELQNIAAAGTAPQREVGAHAVSDLIDPPYRLQHS